MDVEQALEKVKWSGEMQQSIKVNIEIMRIFTKLRTMMLTHKDLLLKMEEMEKKVSGQDEKIKLIFDYLKKFIQQQAKPRKRIGFKQ